jgi:molecular chaperone GrpE
MPKARKSKDQPAGSDASPADEAAEATEATETVEPFEAADAAEVVEASESVEPVEDVDAAEAPSASATMPTAEEAREEALVAEAADLKDQLLRALAETENVRRRLQREKEEGIKYAAAGLAKEMLSVVDNLRRALDSADSEALGDSEPLKALHDGVGLVERELLAIFERAGIKRIEPVGEKFDHDLHQAMFEVPDSDQPNGTVVQLLQPGYVMHGRLLRPALVGVAKGDKG